MRYAIISDIHGNWEALEAVLGECRKLRAEAFLCTGDIVGYGANPKECLDALRKLKAVAIAGNHDWAVSGRLDYSHFTPDGKDAINWSRTRMSFEDIAHLNALTVCLKNKDCVLVHGALKDPEHFTYLDSISKAVDSFALMDVAVCFVGHTHVPKVFIQRGDSVLESEALDIEIDPAYKYIVNVGSVGQPRDGNPMASFCVYDTALRMITNHRIVYDIKKAQGKIIEAGLPENLALRLARGQ